MRKTRGRRDVDDKNDDDDDDECSPSSLLPAGKRRRTRAVAVAANDPALPSDGGSGVLTHGAPGPHGEPAAAQQPEAEGEREAKGGGDLSTPDGVDLEAAIVALLRKRGPGKTC